MAEVREITCSSQVRVNTGNYEGTECLVSMRAELDALDDPDEEVGRLQDMVDGAMLAQLVAVYRSRGKRTTAAAVSKQHGVPLPAHMGEDG